MKIKKSVSAARSAGITETDIRRPLAGGRLGRAIPDHELWEIAKGIKLNRWAMLMKAMKTCDKRLKIKGLPEDIWVAINRAKLEYMMELSVLTKELDEIGRSATLNGNGQLAPHSFGPREQIGNVTGISVTIENAQVQPSVTDVQGPA